MKTVCSIVASAKPYSIRQWLLCLAAALPSLALKFRHVEQFAWLGHKKAWDAQLDNCDSTRNRLDKYLNTAN
jgi:hypothetical protein